MEIDGAEYGSTRENLLATVQILLFSKENEWCQNSFHRIKLKFETTYLERSTPSSH